MDSIVLDFQRELSISDNSITNLLRKGILIASKLNLIDMEKWLTFELEGYNSVKELPDYRKLKGIIYGCGPYVGKIQVSFSDKILEQILMNRPIFNPIPELESMLNKQKIESNDFLILSFSGETQQKLRECFKSDYNFETHLSYYQIQGIVEAVKTELLKWSLRLEKDGILGEGLLFSKEEKEKVAMSPNYMIFNGPIQSAQIQQNTQNSNQSLNIEQPDFEQIKIMVEAIVNQVSKLNLDKNKEEDLKAELQTMQYQLKTSKPKISILKECWSSARNIIEGVTASFIASGLMTNITYLDKFFKP